MPTPISRFIFAILGAALLLSVMTTTGCSVKPDETPEAEVKAATRTEQKANAAAQEAEQRVKEGEAVLDGK